MLQLAVPGEIRQRRPGAEQVAIETDMGLEGTPQNERFVEHDEANKLLRRDYRAPYVVPDEV